MKRALAAIGLLGAVLGAGAAPQRHVVVITFDGLRPDAIAAAPARQVAALAAAGRSTLAARAAAPPETLPNHISMATGLSPAGHGVTTNRELAHPLGRPTLFTAVREAGGRTALYYGKAKLAVLAPVAGADVQHGPAPGDTRWRDGASASLAERFAADFARERFALAWIHLREPDLAGHKSGWMSPDYLAAVREADAALGVIVGAIDASGLPTTVILTADHGGEGTQHWGRQAHDWLVPWICAGRGIAPGELGAAVRTLDVAATALAVLGLPALPGNEGQVVSACLAN